MMEALGAICSKVFDGFVCPNYFLGLSKAPKSHVYEMLPDAVFSSHPLLKRTNFERVCFSLHHESRVKTNTLRKSSKAPRARTPQANYTYAIL